MTNSPVNDASHRLIEDVDFGERCTRKGTWFARRASAVLAPVRSLLKFRELALRDAGCGLDQRLCSRGLVRHLAARVTQLLSDRPVERALEMLRLHRDESLPDELRTLLGCQVQVIHGG